VVHPNSGQVLATTEPSNAMIDRARQTAHDPGASESDLMGAASFLIAWGAFDDASYALQRVAPSGRFRSEVKVLSERISNLRDAPSEFTDQLLASAIHIANSRTATEQQLVLAAENLVKWGSLDEADRVLDRLRTSTVFKGRVTRLVAASRQLRRSGILGELSRLGDSETTMLNRPYELLVARRQASRRAIIVFSGQNRRFWLSLNVLHQFLKRFGCHLIYLSDHSGRMYLNGLHSFGGSFTSMISELQRALVELTVDSVHVMANSSGGFAGLKAALDLGAESFLGLGITTDLSSERSRRAHSWCKDPQLLVNLRQLVQEAESPPRIQLYCGELNATDREQAENMRGLPTVEIHFLAGDAAHDSVSGLLARGSFDMVLKRFVPDQA
jgi:hypothetical protein